MLNKIIFYITISIAVIFGAGYGAGHYVASSKAEKDIAAIRTILEEERAIKIRDEENARRMQEEFFEERAKIRQRRLDSLKESN